MTIGEKIKNFRKLKGYTQKDLARLINKSLDTIKKYEAGTTIPPLKSLNQIASALDILPSFFLHTDELEHDKTLKAYNNALDNGATKRSLINFERNYAEILERYSSLNDFNLQDINLLLYSTIMDILFLSDKSKSLNYSINDFKSEEITELTNFISSSYQLKVNEILARRRKLKEDE